MQMEGWFIWGLLVLGFVFFLQEKWGPVEIIYSKVETFLAPNMWVPKQTLLPCSGNGYYVKLTWGIKQYFV